MSDTAVTNHNGTTREKRCQVCGESLENGTEIVYCANCSTAHHLDCWRFVGQCSTFACGCCRCFSFPVDECSDKEAEITIDDSGQGYTKGKKIPLNYRPSVKPSIVSRTMNGGRSYHGATAPGYVPGDRYSRVDLDTLLELTFRYLAIFCLGIPMLLLDTVKGHPDPFYYFRYFFIAAFLCITTRLFMDCTYILDHENRLLLYGRSIFGYVQTWKICSFSEIQRIGVDVQVVNHKGNTYYYYQLVLKLPNHTCIAISQRSQNYLMTVGFGRWISNHIECPFDEPTRQMGSLTSNGYDIPMEAISAEWKRWPILGSPELIDVLIFFGCAFVLYLTYGP